MKNLLLGIIAINLTFLSIVTTLNYMQTANAASDIQKVMVCNEYGQCADVVSANAYGERRNELRVRD
jgi:hypothetical protein